MQKPADAGSESLPLGVLSSAGTQQGALERDRFFTFDCRQYFYLGLLFYNLPCDEWHLIFLSLYMTVILNIPFPVFKEGTMGQSYPRFSATVILHYNITSKEHTFMYVDFTFIVFNHWRQWCIFYTSNDVCPRGHICCHSVAWGIFIMTYFASEISVVLSSDHQISCLFILLCIQPVMEINIWTLI